MKRYFLLPVILLVATISAYADATSLIILQHKGDMTMFEPDSIQAAVANAVEGDTIILSHGQFPGVRIDKSITIKGAGNKTGVNAIFINGGDNTISPTIQSLCSDYYDNYGEWHSSDIYLNDNTDGLKIIDCRFKNLVVTGVHENLKIQRCLSYEKVNINGSINSGTFENCLFNSLYFRDAAHPNLVFVNATVKYMDTGHNSITDCAQCPFINSVIYRGSGKFNGSTLINCLIFNNSTSSTSYFENCWYLNNWSNDAQRNEWLIENDYIGNDGTPIGYMGGQHPYESTLSAGVPKVSKSKVFVNTEKGTLDVDIEFEY